MTSDEMSELSAFAGSEGYGIREESVIQIHGVLGVLFDELLAGLHLFAH